MLEGRLSISAKFGGGGERVTLKKSKRATHLSLSIPMGREGGREAERGGGIMCKNV
jgi:hypothetical protein